MPSQRATQDDLLADLQSGIERGEFRLEYQPVVRLGGGVVAGAEALVRWRHPRRGTIAPSEFLPLAESSGLIDRIGSFVLEEACRAAASWPRTADRPAFVSVNIVPSQLRRKDAASTILTTLAATGLEPNLLILELTHGVNEGIEAVEASLVELRDGGVRIALDDFGMATSLADLKRLPIDIVKLAREFVTDVSNATEQGVFTTTLINLADTRGVEVVAKGVESREQAWRLAELGCRFGQGFFFSKPLGASGMLSVLRLGTLRG
jgi:EAL domain-containing protein (putative c-di-GMP-specific phosphodiesterase class I)